MNSWHELRKEWFSLLSWHMHREDAHPLDTFMRLLDRAFPGMGEPLSWIVVERRASPSWLARMQGDMSNAAAPRRMDCPILLAEAGGALAIIDGQKRIAEMSARGRTIPVRCLIARCAYS